MHTLHNLCIRTMSDTALLSNACFILIACTLLTEFSDTVLFCWCYFALHACRIATPHLMNSSVSDCEMLNIHLAEFLRMFHIFMIRLLAAADFHMQQSFRSPSSFGCVLNFHSKTKLQDFFGFAFLFRAEKLAF